LYDLPFLIKEKESKLENTMIDTSKEQSTSTGKTIPEFPNYEVSMDTKP
jgi:hypothetical protein